MTDFPELRLLPGRERSLLRHHPWVFSGAAAAEPHGAAPGDVVRVVSSKGVFPTAFFLPE